MQVEDFSRDDLLCIGNYTVESREIAQGSEHTGLSLDTGTSCLCTLMGCSGGSEAQGVSSSAFLGLALPSPVG